MSSSLAKGVLVTIIGEAVLQDRLIRLMTTLGVSGYTIIPAQGAGSHSRRMGDTAGYNTNIEIKTVLTTELSDKILEELKPLQSNHALIAFRQIVDGLFDWTKSSLLICHFKQFNWFCKTRITYTRFSNKSTMFSTIALSY